MSEIIEVNALAFRLNFKRCVDEKLITFYECVLVRSLEYYKRNCKIFLMTEELDAGVAIEKDGRIISVFKCDNAEKGIGRKLVQEAIKRGGKKLECNFMKKLLLGVYFRTGFIPVTSAPLNRDDIYYNALNNEVKYPKSRENGDATQMMYCIYSKEQTKQDINRNFVNFKSIRRFDDEETADKERDKILNNIQANKGLINDIVGYKLYA